MAINFPDSPAPDEIHTQNNRSWKFNGGAWEAYAGETVVGPQGVQGPKGDPGDQGLLPFTLDDVKMLNVRSNAVLVKGYLEEADISIEHRGTLPISYGPDVKFVEIKYTSSIVLEPSQPAQFAEDSVNGTVYIDWENKRLKQSSLRKEGDALHYQHWYESAGEESDGLIMFNTPDITPELDPGANSAEGIIINWSTRTITGLPAYNRTYSNGVIDTALRPYEHQYIFKDLSRGGSPQTGVIEETQEWLTADYNFDEDYINDTGAPLDIRLYVQNDNFAGDSDISVSAQINNGVIMPFVESFKLAGTGAHDDVGNITIPKDATFMFFGGTGTGTPILKWYKMVRTRVIVEQQSPSAVGTATFTNIDNRISLPGVGTIFGLAVGDVVEVTGSTVVGNTTDNNKAFTVTDIVDDNTIEVNDFHKGKQAEYYNHSLVDETETVTVALVCKANKAPLGYGQSWTSAGTFTTYGVAYFNTTGRTIGALAYANTLSGTGTNSISARINDIVVAGNTAGTPTSTIGFRASVYLNVPDGSKYQFDQYGQAGNEKYLYQLR